MDPKNTPSVSQQEDGAVVLSPADGGWATSSTLARPPPADDERPCEGTNEAALGHSTAALAETSGSAHKRYLGSSDEEEVEEAAQHTAGKHAPAPAAGQAERGAEDAPQPAFLARVLQGALALPALVLTALTPEPPTKSRHG